MLLLCAGLVVFVFGRNILSNINTGCCVCFPPCSCGTRKERTPRKKNVPTHTRVYASQSFSYIPVAAALAKPGGGAGWL